VSVRELLEAIAKLRVLVVGDVCLDRWCQYDPALADPSRETGIPRVGVVSTEVTPGAAGTVANNIAAWGTHVSVLGVIGDDGFGYELTQALAARGIGSDLLVRSKKVATFTYTKLLNCCTGAEDLPRIDFVNTRPLPAALEAEVVARISADYDVIIVSDQAETDAGGVVTPAVRDAIGSIEGPVIWVDSRMRAEHFRRVIVKPNREEAEAASVRALGRVDYAALRRHIEAPLLVVTHGGDGALLVDERGERWATARRVEHPADICGAGDSFSAGAALAYRVTGNALEAARFGNLVASVTIMKKGTGTASPAELLEAERVADHR